MPARARRRRRRRRSSCARRPACSVCPTVSDSMLKRAPPEQRRHAVEHAGLVLDVHDERVASCVARISSSAAVSTIGLGPADHVVQVGARRAPSGRPRLPARPGSRSAPCPSCARAASTAGIDVAARSSRGSAGDAVRLGELHEVRADAAASPRSAARRRTPATGAPCRGSRC